MSPSTGRRVELGGALSKVELHVGAARSAPRRAPFELAAEFNLLAYLLPPAQAPAQRLLPL